MASSFVNAPTQGSSAGTQRGPGTEATSMMIAGVKVHFPCKPYPSQMAMMSKVNNLFVTVRLTGFVNGW